MNRLPYNEFTNDLEYMASMDTAYHHEKKDYRKIVCVQCSEVYYRRKTEAVESDLCGKCLSNNLKSTN